jgi:outer membrane protein assembly factor BamB
MKSPCLLLSRGFCLVLPGFFTFVAWGEDWPNFRGPDHNGISKETDWLMAWPQEGPKRLWQTSVGTGFSSMAAAAGRVYTMGNVDNRDTVYCFDANSGKQLWRHSYDEPLAPKYYEGGTSGTPSVDEGLVYTSSKQGQLFCLQTADGKVVWQKHLAKELGLTEDKDWIPDWGFAGSVLVMGDRLILNMGATGTALDKKTGKTLWSSGKDAAGYSTPVPFQVGAETYVAFFTRAHLVAATVGQGKELWRYPWKTKYDVNAANPLVFGDKIFLSAGYDHGCALLKFTGSIISKIWENKNLRNMLNSSVMLGDYIYGIDGDGGDRNASLRCLDVATGSVRWKEPSVRAGSLIAADGKLIVLSEQGELIIAQATAETFRPLARAKVLGGKCWTSPVLANGRIYCRNAKGDLVCVDVRR